MLLLLFQHSVRAEIKMLGGQEVGTLSNSSMLGFPSMCRRVSRRRDFRDDFSFGISSRSSYAHVF